MSKRRRLPTLRSLARRLRAFTRGEHRAASDRIDDYLDAVRGHGVAVKIEGKVPDELYDGVVSVSYARADTNESEAVDIPFVATSGPAANTDATRFAICADAALATVQEFALSGVSRYVLSASWTASLTTSFDAAIAGTPPPRWHDGGDLPAGENMPYAPFHPGGRAHPRARKTGTVWRVTRHSTAKGAKVRSRNTGRVEDWM